MCYVYFTIRKKKVSQADKAVMGSMVPHLTVRVRLPCVGDPVLDPSWYICNYHGLSERAHLDVVISCQDKVSPDVFEGARPPAV